MEKTKSRELLSTNLPGVYVAPSTSEPGTAHIIVVREDGGRLAGIECACPGAVHRGQCWHRAEAFKRYEAEHSAAPLPTRTPEWQPEPVYDGRDHFHRRRIGNGLYG